MLILLRMGGSHLSGQKMCSDHYIGLEGKWNVLLGVLSFSRKSCAMNSIMLGFWKLEIGSRRRD